MLYKENQNHANFPIYFESSGLFVSRGEWIHGVRTIGSYEIMLVVSGKVYIYEGEKQYCLEKNNLLILSPGVEHGGIRASRDVSFYWLHFRSDIEFSEKYFRFQDTAGLVGLFRMLLHNINTPFYPRSSSEYITRLILNEIEFLSGKENTDGKTAYMAAQYVAANIKNRPVVSDVAEHMGYNADYLCRLFKKEFGVSLKKYIAEETVKAAKLYLIETGRTVAETAKYMGYENENLFVKFFKYHEGITPTQYVSMFYNTHINHK